MRTFTAAFRYEVDPSVAPQFEQTYGPTGAWVKLFGQTPGYIGTELWRATHEPGVYLVFDRWTSEDAYESFLTAHRDQYDRLGHETEGLYRNEDQLGRFEALALLAP